ncbi:hypothetical protein Asppvi_001987 [Aspergillus pseudoviridinutans]|uniref:beta-galactosidase n=1 Tax=Aspergillus pseudoviridinutans TaxID=1517512 RepID=A0A9P3EY38_9EURO|nr:uncharacterized protein Asppvi_001987 [Aspergillus pseudoviridinutans]GIJ92709.1 hypothetical protein Asppvi_001987 [Aspergillus pseudoviridinutans]
MDGTFAYDEFFNAARTAGIYVIVRPGPYINAEASAGGLPGWRMHAPEGLYWRVSNGSYYNEIELYVQTVGKMLAPHQITEGGPIIMLQLENELSSPVVGGAPFPPTGYMDYLKSKFAETGMVVPTFHNDVSHGGKWAHVAPPDVNAYDNYPLSCTSIPSWMNQNDWSLYLQYSNNTPHMIAEYMDGFYDAPDGPGYSDCPVMYDAGVTRLFYKDLHAMSVMSLNLYMIYGGTNWGHIGWGGVYTSYDYRAAIAEDRSITREKYSDIKLQSQFLKVSPAFLTSRLTTHATSIFTTSSDVVVTQTKDDKGNTTFWTSRHAVPRNTASVNFSLHIPTSLGNFTIPQLGGTLKLDGYDSRIHVSDYAIGTRTILYSTAEILSWQKLDSKYVVLVYGATVETHETAFISSGNDTCVTIAGSTNDCQTKSGTVVVNYNTSGVSVVAIGADVMLYILDRNTAYTTWAPEVSSSNDVTFVRGPYLVRSAVINGSTLSLRGDLNSSTEVEIIAPQAIDQVEWNGNSIQTSRTSHGSLSGTLSFTNPTISLPNLSQLTWRIPDDSKWTVANHTTSANRARELTTHVSLYTGDYGYHVGAHLFRGHFVSNGTESGISFQLSGGYEFGYSVWLNDTFLGASGGSASSNSAQFTLKFPHTLSKGLHYVLTVLSENMGYNENESGGITFPRGILNYNLERSNATIEWKITRNLGGENYADLIRGPLNEGGFYAERMGWHQPNPPSQSWATKSPLQGVATPGVEIFTTSFDLNLPTSYDIPLAVSLQGTTGLRAHLYINGYMFGRYEQSIGPQTLFPIPEGIINHQGSNTIAPVHWNVSPNGGRLATLSLSATGVYQSGYGAVASVPQPSYTARSDAF